ncbi:MAG TPA: flagellin [Cyanobacteria bacterium UBA9971]|nr:flagellin [Cyanobacteria bacterium UBA9971]
MVVNNNIASLIAQRNLSTNSTNLVKSIERLSSGYRINRASDDAAGLSISENLRGQIRGNKQAINNIQDGINMLQIAESSLSVINENIQRIRELAVQAANDTNSSVEKDAILCEVNARLADIDRIAKATKFNNIKLLDGTASAVLQVGADSELSTNTIEIENSVLSRATVSCIGTTASVNGLALTATGATWSSNGIRLYIDVLDAALSDITTRRSNLGAYQNRLESALENLTIMNENIQNAESRVRDLDVAKETANMTKYQILQQASASVLAQANALPQVALKLLG